MLKTKLAYLIGTDHCGSTLLAFLFNSHPDLVSLGESSAASKYFNPEYICSCNKKINECEFYLNMAKMIDEEGHHFSAYNWDNIFSYNNKFLNRMLGGYSRKPLKHKFQKYADKYLPVHMQRIERIKKVNLAYFRAAIKLTNTKVYCDTSKDLRRIYYLNQIVELDTHLIWVIRDLRAFVYSCSKFGQSPIKSANQWLRYQLGAKELFDSFPSDKKMQVKYEHLCQNPNLEFEKIYDLVNIENISPPETIDPQKHHILGNKMRRGGLISIKFDEAWRRNLSKDDIAIAVGIAGDVNNSLGYH